MYKTYVLDTNVLLQAPHSLFSFEENNVVLPVAVLEELDKFKSDENELGASARQVIRALDKLRGCGNLIEGIKLENGGTLRVILNYSNIEIPTCWNVDYADNRILKVCKGLIDDGENAIIVSRDILVRIKADVLKIPAQDFLTDRAPKLDKQYKGRLDVFAPNIKIDNFKKKGIAVKDIYIVNDNGHTESIEPILNQFFIIHSDTSNKKTVLGRYNGETIVPLQYINSKPFGVEPRSVGQRFLQEALMQDANIAPLVIVKGPAGTAKTFYSFAVGLEKILEQKEPLYRRILVTRPNVQFDQEIGFLPGSEQEKISPYLRPVIDNLEILVDRDEKQRYQNEKELKNKVDELFDRGIITTEAMNFIRGRSIAKTWLIIDEAQNLTPKQVKGIITRVGSGTKVILLGDPEQIDHPLLDVRTNGLSYAAEKMKGSPYCWQITMNNDECERSRLALDATERM